VHATDTQVTAVPDLDNLAEVLDKSGFQDPRGALPPAIGYLRVCDRRDPDALGVAEFAFQRITTRETIDLMCMAVADEGIGAAEALSLMNQMADRDRYLRLLKSVEELRR
jgi:hypothetical protein